MKKGRPRPGAPPHGAAAGPPAFRGDGNRAGPPHAQALVTCYALVTFSRPGPTFLQALRVSTTHCDCFTTMP